MRSPALLLVFAVVTAALMLVVAPTASAREVPLFMQHSATDDAEANAISTYIIMFNDKVFDTDIDSAIDIIQRSGGSIRSKFTVLKGLTCDMPKSLVVFFEKQTFVKSIEEDGTVHALDNDPKTKKNPGV